MTRVPILKLDNMLLTSIQVDLSDDDFLHFQSDLLHKIVEENAEGVCIDVSAVDLVDSFMAKVINDTTQMIELLGTEVVICGLQPPVALTLIEMGGELLRVNTALNLSQGLKKLRFLIAQKYTKSS